MDTVKAVQQAIDYMEDHLCEHLEPERIAEAAFMSLPNLYRVFYAMTGHPLMEYIRKRRINRAAVLLRHTDAQVLDIALDCGFDSYRTFATVFKKFTGLTPGMYRKAESFYSFERVNLLERVSYTEDRELSLHHPDVKVIRVCPVQAAAYRHASAACEGLEEEAFRIFYGMLSAAGLDAEKNRLLGYNVEPESGGQTGMHEYVIMAPGVQRSEVNHPDVFDISLPGGLYAAGKAPAGPAGSIIAAWNRMLAQWLPRSSFKLGEHRFVEEFHHHRGKITRLKLFLPVTRKHEQETIGITELPPVSVASFRSTGCNAQSVADDQLTAWLIGRGMAGDADRPIFMSYSYGIADGDDAWYELGVPVSDEMACSPEDAGRIKWMEGGTYAYMTTGAYGVMTGVLDMLHDWLLRNAGYRLDDGRCWFAAYIAGVGTDLERSTTVTCYIPVIRSQ